MTDETEDDVYGLELGIRRLRNKFPFVPYQPAFCNGNLVQVMSFPTPGETIMVRTVPGDATTLVEIPAKKLVTVLRYLLGDVGIERNALALVVERLGIDEGPEVALLFVNECIRERIDLSASWSNVRHYLHDVLRRGSPEAERENVYQMTISELCDSVAIFVKRYYD